MVKAATQTQTMFFSIKIFFFLHFFVYVFSFRESSDVGLNPVEIIENHGYTCETHYITTEDDYILTTHRIPEGKSKIGDGEKKPAVLLMHGLVSSSADYVNMGPERSLAYILADLGYDVWLGNARGNTFSRNHTTLTVTDNPDKFFNFSWHEIGFYDVAATIDYILDLNGDESLDYIGHSQGTTAFLVLASTRPEYNEKIKIASLMAPAAFMEHRPESITTILCQYIEEVEALLNDLKIFELPIAEFLRQWAMENCDAEENYDLCTAILWFAGGAPDLPQLDFDMLPVIGTNAPADAAMKQFLHYGQQIKNGGFSLYDYGPQANSDLYGSEKPPAYDLSQITTPVAIYYGSNDDVVNYQDVETLISKLPNVVNDYLVPYELFNHIDFVFAKDVVDLVYNELISTMQKNSVCV